MTDVGLERGDEVPPAEVARVQPSCLSGEDRPLQRPRVVSDPAPRAR